MGAFPSSLAEGISEVATLKPLENATQLRKFTPTPVDQKNMMALEKLPDANLILRGYLAIATLGRGREKCTLDMSLVCYS